MVRITPMNFSIAAVVLLDSYGQHSVMGAPSDLPETFEMFRAYADAVLGGRKNFLELRKEMLGENTAPRPRDVSAEVACNFYQHLRVSPGKHLCKELEPFCILASDNFSHVSVAEPGSHAHKAYFLAWLDCQLPRGDWEPLGHNLRLAPPGE